MKMTLEDVKALPRAVDYEGMVTDLFKDMGTRSASAIHGILGILGEVGELIPAIIRGDFDNIVEESGDAMFYAQGIMGLFNWDFNKAYVFTAYESEEDLLEAFLKSPIDGMVYYAGAGVADALKKEWAYTKELDVAKVLYNLQGFMSFFACFLTDNRLTFGDITAHNQYKLVTGPNARYKTGKYSNEQAIARADKVEEHRMSKTQFDHVWRDEVTGKFHYSDEDEQIDPVAHDTAVDANKALDYYVQHTFGK